MNNVSIFYRDSPSQDDWNEDPDYDPNQSFLSECSTAPQKQDWYGTKPSMPREWFHIFQSHVSNGHWYFQLTNICIKAIFYNLNLFWSIVILIIIIAIVIIVYIIIFVIADNNWIIYLLSLFLTSIFYIDRYDDEKEWAEEKFIVGWSFLSWALSICRTPGCARDKGILLNLLKYIH